MNNWVVAVASMLAVGAAFAAPGGPSKGLNPSAAAVVVDSVGNVVGPVVPIPYQPGYLYYGEVGAAYRVGGAVARVGFLAATGWQYGVLTRVYAPRTLYFVSNNCTGQAYSERLPADYVPYSSYLVVPALTLSGVVVAPARVYQQAADPVSGVLTYSASTNDATCVQNAYPSGSLFPTNPVADFPFIPPFSIK